MSFEQFIKERKYLHNVAERTIQWYEESFKWLGRYELTEEGLKDFVIGMRQAGLKPISCNNRIRVANAYFKWAKLPLHINRLKEEQRQLPVFSHAQISRLLGFKPKGFYQTRLHTLILTLLDTGLRIDEAVNLQRTKIDFDNLLLTVTGKGNKERIIPFSNELRKSLYRFSTEHSHNFVFSTHDGNKMHRNVVLRDFKILCKKLGMTAPPRALHAIRHTFATEYIRRGGSQFMLMKVLGHTTLEMTKKYVNFQTEDLSAVHNRLSLLTR